MKRLLKYFLIIFLLSLFLPAGCKRSYKLRIDTDKNLQELVLQHKVNYPRTRFAVVSDIHLYDRALGVQGLEYMEYLYSDRKLLTHSIEIFSVMIKILKELDVDFILIPGDLTKDSELHNHRIVARKLAEVKETGKQVFVVPGNHDINHPYSYRYTHEGAIRIPNINASKFAEIYGDFGYNNAIYRDEHSLSYVAEPVDGLWIIGLDACRYDEFTENKAFSGGKFKPGTLVWLEDILIESVKENKDTIAFMHHAVLEHFKAQAKDFPNYVVDDHGYIGYLLASYNVRLVFTGHFHSQSIVYRSWGNNNAYPFIFDIQTGSIITYPCPYRIIEITAGQKAIINSHFITAIPSYPVGFPEYARGSYLESMEAMVRSALSRLKLTKRDKKILAGQIALAFLAHTKGDEIKPDNFLDTKGISLWGRFIVLVRRRMVRNLYTNLYPADNDLVIDLISGKTWGPE